MARCVICSRTGQSGHNVSHSKRSTKTRWLVNIQRATIEIDSAPRTVLICTRCLRNQYKAAMKD